MPLEPSGEKANNIVSFARVNGESRTIVIAPRFFSRLVIQPEDLPLGKVWSGSFISVPFAVSGEMYRNIFTGELVDFIVNDNLPVISLDKVLTNFPLALLERVI